MTCAEKLGSLWTAVASVLGSLALAGGARGQDQAANRVAAERLLWAVQEDYSYRDRLQLDWPARFADFQPRLLAAKNQEEFAERAAELLGAAQDVHIWLKHGDRTVGTYQPDLRPNFNPRILPRLLPQLKQYGKTVVVGSWPDGIRYVLIATWDNRDPAAMREAVAAVRAAAQARAPLILDVRPNAGGEELQARQVAAFFVAQPTAYAQHIARVRGKDLPPQTRMLAPEASGVRHPGPCVVLMGPANISSCESFLLMMRAAGRPLIGAPTPGASGNPQPHDLGNGLVVLIPSWRNLSRDGRELEGIGITPDLAVKTQPSDFATSDPVLLKGLEYLRTPGQH